MRGEYWFNTEPISKHVDIIFEYDEYQIINDVVQLCSIDELKHIIDSFKKRIPEKRPAAFEGEYFSIDLDFGFCTVIFELPNQTYGCFVTGDKLIEILERYVLIYEDLDNRFKM